MSSIIILLTLCTILLFDMMTVMIHSDAHLNEILSASVIHTIVIDMRDYFSKSIHNTFIYTASAIMYTHYTSTLSLATLLALSLATSIIIIIIIIIIK